MSIWEGRLWRATASLAAEVSGFTYLEPRRHIPSISALSGEEAGSLGTVLATITRILKEVTGASQTYIYVFGGGIDHLHLHLAPHHPGDALSDHMIRGETVARPRPDSAVEFVSKDFPPLPESELRAVADRAREKLRDARPETS